MGRPNHANWLQSPDGVRLNQSSLGFHFSKCPNMNLENENEAFGIRSFRFVKSELWLPII